MAVLKHKNSLLACLHDQIQIQFILVAFVKRNCNTANTHNHDEIIIYIATGKLRIDLLGHRVRQPPHTIPSCFRILINIAYCVEFTADHYAYD